MDLGKLNNDDSFVIGSNQALFVNHIVETVKEMLGKVQSSDDVHDRIRGQHIVPQQKVFISFGGHGDDTRLGFSSHLQAGLKRSGINFYINIENMTKGYYPEELIMNVRESRIALVIFTESYLSSAWDGRQVEINNQLVLNWGATDARINRWKQALNSVGERLGFVYANPSSEAEFVEYIICETKRTLANTSSS
ncbi:hypothetical protein DY000_02018854 [Brassica cretica]|uniref:TIR domain-containing protein n=1 Tax=Brassica cretica TaxID=69181 RepID=A0ABQ7CTE5_BRACR|nr:hypothetical protein DY000_02018854 [Brassica cretica]